jgi:aminopeptidase N
MKIKYLLIISILTLTTKVNAQEDDDLYNKAMAQYTLQDYIGAIETFDSIIKLKPENGEAKFYRMASMHFLNDYEDAKADFIKYKKEFPSTSADQLLRLYYDDDFRLKFLSRMFYKDDKLFKDKGYRPLYTKKDTLRGALRPERTCFDVTYYDLALKINPKKKTIAGSNTITFKVVSQTSKIQIDLFSNYLIESIKWNNKELNYIRDCDALFITFPEVLNAGTMQSITISYSGKPRVAPNPPWDGGFVWKKDECKNYWDGVACEQLGASSWWPCKDHLSDEPDSMGLTFDVPKGYKIVSNGNQRSEEDLKNGYTRFKWFVSYPINTYDATFYLGKFVQVCDTMFNNSGSYALDYYVLPPNKDKAKKYFQQTKQVLAAYEYYFGDYPFMRDGFAFVESPYEGMEHQGAIAYGNGYDNPRKAQPYVNKKEDMIIVHESAHEWWGNSITVNDMTDIWMQEGFATYAEYLYFEKQYDYTEYIKELSNAMGTIFNFWPLIQNYDVNENGFASNDCYRKGAAILQNIRCILNNDSLFFKIIKDFSLKYRYKTVNSSDFEKFVTEKSGQDFTAFFNKYLRDKNLPVLEFSYKKEGTDILFSYKWTEVGEGFQMPFCISDGVKNFRLEGNTTEKQILLKDAKTVRFFTQFINPEKADKNSLTYFWTKMKKL